MTLFNTSNKSMMLSKIFTKQNGRKNKIKMDSYDVHIHPIKFHLYDKEFSGTSNIITNILEYITILFIGQEEFEDIKGLIRIRKSKQNIQHNGQKKKYKRTNIDLQNIHIKLNMNPTNKTRG